MPSTLKTSAGLLSLLAAYSASALAQQPVSLTSPGGNVRVTVATRQVPGSTPAGPRLVYSVQHNGKDVLLESPFELDVHGAPPFGAGVAIQDVKHRTVNDTWQRVWGRRKQVRNHFNEATVTLREIQAPNRTADLVFRAYDDGVGFRYVLPEPWGEFALRRERTGFAFAGEPTVWAANYGGFHSSQEGEYVKRPLSQLAPDSVYGLPMLVRLDADRWAAITEADLDDWAGMHLSRAAYRPQMLVSRLSPRPNETDVAVRSRAPRASPWRVVLLGSTAGDLVATDLVQNLNDPPARDFSWVKPGISSWNWWNGPYAPDADFKVGMNTATMKYFVDLAAEMGWEYVLIDEGWYGPAFAERHPVWSKHPTSKITGAIPELDLLEVIRYARERNVRPVLWLHWGHVADQMEQAFPLYEKWGVAGIKIDFMDRDDQEMVNYYDRVAKLAAKHHLMVDFHGAYKPTGESRTHPNLVTREGVLGNEYNKWSARVTPEHNVTIPFTRGILGEMDFTPGGFRNRTPEEFKAVDVAPQVMGTRAHQLAMFVIYESAFQVASDSRYTYRTSPAGTDLLKVVPTTWDDTRVLGGEPGDYITMARRSGRDWYVASMSDEQARTFPVPLDFLGPGQFRAEIWADAPDAAQNPEHLVKQQRIVTARDTLSAAMAPGGGYVVRLTPVQ